MHNQIIFGSENYAQVACKDVGTLAGDHPDRRFGISNTSCVCRTARCE